MCSCARAWMTYRIHPWIRPTENTILSSWTSVCVLSIWVLLFRVIWLFSLFDRRKTGLRLIHGSIPYGIGNSLLTADSDTERRSRGREAVYLTASSVADELQKCLLRQWSCLLCLIGAPGKQLLCIWTSPFDEFRELTLNRIYMWFLLQKFPRNSCSRFNCITY